MRPWPDNEKAIVIDTTEYAGNFEREMVAFVTGLVGECGVGGEAAEVARGELSPEALQWFDEHVEFISDEHGCARPANLAPTPGWYNNGTGTHRRLKNPKTKPKYAAYLSVSMVVSEWPPDDIMQVIRERVRFFCDNSGRGTIPLTGIRCVERVVVESLAASYEP
jgi:hypothetical protein